MVDYYSLRCYHHEIGKKAHEPKHSVLLLMFFISPDNVIIFEVRKTCTSSQKLKLFDFYFSVPLTYELTETETFFPIFFFFFFFFFFFHFSDPSIDFIWKGHQHYGQHDITDGKIHRPSGRGRKRENRTTGGRETKDRRPVIQDATKVITEDSELS